MEEASETISNNSQSPLEVGKKKKNFGRIARRRRKKILAIELAAAQATLGTTITTDKSDSSSLSTSILPQDRGFLWPAVKDLCQLSDKDKHALIGQLGYLPGNAIKVVARANDYFPSRNDDEPLAIQLYPLVYRHASDSTKSHRKRKQRQNVENSSNDQEASVNSKQNPLVEPFPTMYWVTHPGFRAIISKLELRQQEHDNGKSSDGSIRHFEKRLETDSTAFDAMRLAHQKYGQDRRHLITDLDWKWIQERNWEGAFAVTRGIAGIRNPAGIKCLHAHAAHYWSGCKENVVGKWVSDEVQALLDDAKKSSTSSSVDR